MTRTKDEWAKWLREMADYYAKNDQRMPGGFTAEADLILSAIAEAREEAIEECAKFVEGGAFLTMDSPEAKFGKACAAGIRRLSAGGGN